ncbi:MAG TPA: DUF4115 domain-containing protein [Acidimicrobiales bacterium]|nr:DUF4115 domain-containing protein [Acidimicrobiales bacterium]
MLLLVLVLAVGALFLFIYLARRGSASELQSVRSHQGAMATMERLESRALAGDGPPPSPSPPPSTVPPPSTSPQPPTSPPSSPLAEEAATGARPAAGSGSVRTRPPGTGPVGRPVVRPARLVFDDASLPDSRPQGPVGVRRERRVEQHALASMNREPRQVSSYLVVLVLAVLAAALAYLAVHHPAHRSAARASTSSSAGHRGTSSGTGPSRTGATSRRGAPRRSSPAPAPRPSRLLPSSATAGTATYTLPVAAYTLSVSASQTCWVQATSQPSGTVLWEGLLGGGASRSVPATGQTVVVLGASGASMTVNGVPVVLPAPAATPFRATFVPAPATSST